MKKLILFTVICFGLVGCSKDSNTKQDNETTSKSEVKKESNTGKWRLVVSKDEMRNTESKWLALSSDNNADLSFPYDGVNRLNIDILDSKTDEPRIFVSIDKGQYDCESYGCSAAVKFGNAPIQYLTFQKYEVSGGDGTILVFSGNSKAFLSNVRNFNSIIIELPFYREGTRQFKFDTSKFSEAEKGI